MSVTEQPQGPGPEGGGPPIVGPKSAGLVARVQAILLRPQTEWDVINAEPATVQGLFTGYACILAAIPALATLIRGLFPVCFLVCIRLNLTYVIASAVVDYVLSLVSVFLMALVIDALAPSFSGEKNQLQATKLAVYSMTAFWVAGIFLALPMLSVLSLLGLYSFYLLYTGIPKLMKAPQDKVVVYAIVAVVVSLVVNIVVYAVGNSVANLGRGPADVTIGAAGPVIGGATVTGVDLGKVQTAAAAVEASARAMQTGQTDGKVVAAIDPEKLKSLLPDTVAGMARSDVSAESVGAGGMASSHAEAVYSKGGESVTVKITDLALMGPMASMAGAVNLHSSRDTATGYERTSTEGGRLIVEKWDNASKSGEYSMVVGGRFAVEASGSAPSIDDLKGAVAAVGPDRLQAMAKA